MKAVKDITSKLEKNEQLTDDERELLVAILKQQSECIKYYSQNFAGTWDNNEVNINWHAHKCNEQIESKVKEIKEKNVIDVNQENSG